MEIVAPPSPGGSEETVDLIQKFRAQGFKVEDHRSRGGALWVYDGSRQLETEMRALRDRGLRFYFSPKRAGWFLK